jgi:hypothetical protein
MLTIKLKFIINNILFLLCVIFLTNNSNLLKDVLIKIRL